MLWANGFKGHPPTSSDTVAGDDGVERRQLVVGQLRAVAHQQEPRYCIKYNKKLLARHFNHAWAHYRPLQRVASTEFFGYNFLLAFCFVVHHHGFV